MVFIQGLCLLVFCASASSTQISTRVFYKQNRLADYVFDGGYLESKTAFSELVCCNYCLLDSRCSATSYNSDQSLCRLHKIQRYNPTGGRAELGWRHWAMGTGCPVSRGYVYDQTLTFCYKVFINETGTWSEAEAVCQRGGGHLLILDTQDKYDSVTAEIDNLQAEFLLLHGYGSTESNYFLDLAYDTAMPGWVWSSTGQLANDSALTVSFSSLGTGNTGGTGTYGPRVGAIGANSDHQWRSIPRAHNHSYICQIDV